MRYASCAFGHGRETARCYGASAGLTVTAFATRSAAARAVPMQAGTPDAVQRRPGDGEPGQPGDRVLGRPDPLDVADGVLRQPATPPLHVHRDRRGADPGRARRGRRGRARRSSASSTCSVAASPNRPSDARSRTSPSVARARCGHFREECVAALIDIGSPAATRTPEVAGSRSAVGRRGTRARRRPTTRAPPRPAPARRPARSRPAAARPRARERPGRRRRRRGPPVVPWVRGRAATHRGAGATPVPWSTA